MGHAILLNQERIFEGFAKHNEKVNINTNFRLASLSKQFTAAAIILLKQKKRIKYSDKLADFLPNFDKRIEIQHLLNHSSGIWNYESLIPENQISNITDEMITNWLQNKKEYYFEPGQKFQYSNGSYCILTQIIEKVSEKSFTQFIKDEIFFPLKMNETAYPIDEIQNRAIGFKNGEIFDQSLTSSTLGDGCIYSSIFDYQKWLEAIHTNTLFDLKKELNLSFQTINNKLNYGFGWFFDKQYNLYHTGSTCGFSNLVITDIEGSFSFVFLSNENDNHANSYNLINHAYIDKNLYSIDEILNLTD